MVKVASVRQDSRLLAAANRFAAVIVGGYALAFGFVALAALSGFKLGLPYFEAQSLAWLLGFAVYLGAVITGFVPKRTSVVWLAFAGGGAVMSAIAFALSRAT